MSRRCRRIRAMKVLVESVETGVCSRLVGLERERPAGSLLRSGGGVNRDAGTLARISRSILGGRPFRLSTPKPSACDFSRQSLGIPAEAQPFRRIRAGTAMVLTPDAVHRPKGRVKLGREATARAPGQDPLLLFNSLRRYTLSHTRYRTIPFDNLRPSCKSRAYWGFEKFRNNEDTAGNGKCDSPEGSD